MNTVIVNINDTIFLLAITITIFIITFRIALKSDGVYKGFFTISGLMLSIIGIIFEEIIRSGITTLSNTLILLVYILSGFMTISGLILMILGIILMIKRPKK